MSSPATAPQALIMLIDDEEEFGSALSFRLETRNLPCFYAARGESALENIHLPELEVVLLDINMPGMHGLDVLTAIKEKRPELEVILLTGESNVETAARGMRRGAGDYLLKPVDFENLLTAINRARMRVAVHKERLRAVQAGHLLALGTLATGVAHEVNNPLQIITQAAEWLEELLDDYEQGKCDGDVLRDAAQKIHRNALRCGKIVAQLLDLSSRTRQHTASTQLPDLLEKVLSHAQERVESLQVTVTLDCAENTPLVACSPAELEPVFVHLIKNSLDALESRQESEQQDADQEFALMIQVTPSAESITITVADTGEGIPAELLPAIYDPFFSTKPVGKGAGLGLTVCHSIISAMRGHIAHTSLPSGGTLCSVKLPKAMVYSS